MHSFALGEQPTSVFSMVSALFSQNTRSGVCPRFSRITRAMAHLLRIAAGVSLLHYVIPSLSHPPSLSPVFSRLLQILPSTTFTSFRNTRGRVSAFACEPPHLAASLRPPRNLRACSVKEPLRGNRQPDKHLVRYRSIENTQTKSRARPSFEGD